MEENKSEESAVDPRLELWLTNFLRKNDIVDHKISVKGTSDKSDGFFADIVYLTLSGTTQQGQLLHYSLVLKCSYPSEVFRTSYPVKETFENEDYMYSTVFPAFIDYQKEKGAKEILHCWPEYFGNYMSAGQEVIIMEDLKSIGYALWENQQPLDRGALHLLLKTLARYHAISLAMADQQPEKFKKLAAKLKNVWNDFNKDGSINNLFGSPIDDSFDIVKDHLDDKVFQAWKNYRKEVPYLVDEMVHITDCVTVISHGDCWKNNVLFKFDNGRLVDVKFLDFQVPLVSHPILDTSSLLYTAMSPDDLKDFHAITKDYHDCLCEWVKILGSDPEKLFPYSTFMNDWKKFGKYGLVKVPISMKVFLAKMNDIPDKGGIFESGQRLSNIFENIEIKRKEEYVRRMVPVIEHAYEFGIIE